MPGKSKESCRYEPIHNDPENETAEPSGIPSLNWSRSRRIPGTKHTNEDKNEGSDQPMSKKKSPTRIDPINLPRRLREGLAEADTLLSEKQPQQALALLHELNVKFPRQIDVLGLMADACLELGDTRGYLRALHPLQALLPHQADIKFALAYAYSRTVTWGFPCAHFDNTSNTGRMIHGWRMFRRSFPNWNPN